MRAATASDVDDGSGVEQQVSDGAQAPAESVDGAQEAQSRDVAQDTAESVDAAQEEQAEPEVVERPKYRIYAEKHDVSATIETTLGTICCDLFIEDHPLTVLNFMSLVRGNPAWTDRSGQAHVTPFYENLKFDIREKGKFVSVGERPEGTNFFVKDERCTEHKPVAGSLMMSQTYPGRASTRIVILAREIEEFSGMYTVFGQCVGQEVIQELTRKDASVVKISLQDGKACAAQGCEGAACEAVGEKAE